MTTEKTRKVLDLFDGIEYTLKIAEDILFAFEHSDITIAYLVVLKRFLQDLITMHYATQNKTIFRQQYAQDLFNRRFQTLINEFNRHKDKENAEKAKEILEEESTEEGTRQVQSSLL